jgi:citrate lyase subunit beta / citryl-CoA lyase
MNSTARGSSGTFRSESVSVADAVGLETRTQASLTEAVSFLFAPGSDERKLGKALATTAHAVIADLEDAVVPEQKVRARDIVRDALAGPASCVRLVRVNAVGTLWHAEDLALVSTLGVDGVVLPKATPAAAAAVAGELGVPLIAIIETAAGLGAAQETAAVPDVNALQLGAVDLGLELGLEQRPDGLELLVPRSNVVLASAIAGRRGPIDRVWLDIRDEDGLREDSTVARSLGFRGKACIHPAQVDVVNEAFAPSAAEIAQARAVIAAFDEAAAASRGAVALDGRMIDLPVVERARRILANVDEGDTSGD